jgi:thiol-disulfide isomerase/thioredoxin
MMRMDYRLSDLYSDLLIVALAAALIVGVHRLWTSPLRKALVRRAERSQRRQPTLTAGTIVDESWSVQTLDGEKTIPMSSLRGHVLFVNFWATWCAPCRAEFSGIERLYGQSKDKDVIFLCLSQENPTYLQRYLRKHPLGLPVYRVRDLPDSWQVSALPSTFIISREGKLSFSRTGAYRWDQPAITALLDSLLKESYVTGSGPTREIK